jgi:two-component system chemotaxis sensor kinase CheA
MGSNKEIDELVADYLGEARDYIELLNETLLRVSAQQGPWPMDDINEMFRTAHSLKGLSACFGFDRSNAVTHQLESLMTKVRDGQIQPERHVVRQMFDAIDVVSQLTTEIAEEGNETSEIDLLVQGLKALCESSSDEPTTPVAAATDDADAAAAPAPAPEATAGDAAASRNDGAKKKAPESNETVRVRMDRLDNLVNMTGELVITRSRFQVVSRNLRHFARIIEHRATAQDLFNGLHEMVEQLPSDSHHIELAEQLRDMSARLRSALVDLGDIPATLKELEDTAYDLDGVVGGIHENVLQVRMVPLDSVFRRLQRVVRDTAEQLGKDVDLQLLGGETQIDKRVADELVNPLVHMLRNSVDHGLEPAATRTAAGKPARGTVQVKSFQRGSSVVIEVSDDGGGINPGRVKQKAIDTGLITADEAAAMSDADAQRLVMKPGFSTAGQVTAVSGRGMGMDIVEDCIKSLRGTMDLVSTVGEGTTFTIQLPPSMSILSSLLLEVGGTTFALPLTEVREIVELASTRRHRVQSREMLVVRERPIPLILLPETYRFPASAAQSQPTHAVIFGFGRKEIALGVDHLLGKEDLVIKPLCPELSSVRGLAGMAIRGEGRVTLILEPGTFAEHALQRASANTQQIEQPQTRQEPTEPTEAPRG